VILYLDRKKVLKRKGSLFLVYCVGYGLGRFLLELIRTDTTFRFLGLSRNAYVALIVLIAGCVLLFVYERRAPTPPVEGEGDAEGSNASRSPANESSGREQPSSTENC
jgi:prolipoprotein diacylglyceryltransferase